MRHRIVAAGIACAALAAPAVAESPVRFPTRDGMEAARAFADARTGVIGFAVMDTNGRLRGWHGRRRFVSASVTKAMLLVAYLRKVARQERELAHWERRHLRPMIRRSSNRAASWVYARVGDGRLRRLASRAQMRDFTVCCRWTNAYFSARDQARFFWKLQALTPRRFEDYALGLLRRVRPRQSWAIPKLARPRGFRVHHKSGWRPTARGKLFHQAALLRRPDIRFSLAVLTDGNPSRAYGIRTVRGVARRVLRGSGSSPKDGRPARLVVSPAAG